MIVPCVCSTKHNGIVLALKFPRQSKYCDFKTMYVYWNHQEEKNSFSPYVVTGKGIPPDKVAAQIAEFVKKNPEFKNTHFIFEKNHEE